MLSPEHRFFYHESNLMYKYIANAVSVLVFLFLAKL
jgi:hypothetical protein